MNFPVCTHVRTHTHSAYIHQITVLKIFYHLAFLSLLPHVLRFRLPNKYFFLNLYWTIIHPHLYPFHSFFLECRSLLELKSHQPSRNRSTSLPVKSLAPLYPRQNLCTNKLFLILIFYFSSIKMQIATPTSNSDSNHLLCCKFFTLSSLF